MTVPWTARRSNQSILKEIKPEYSLEGLMLKLKLQYFGYLMQRAGSLVKTVMLGKLEGKRRRGGRGWDDWMASLTQWTWVWATPGDSEQQESLVCCSPWGRKELDTTEWLNNNNKTINYKLCNFNSFYYKWYMNLLYTYSTDT